MIGKIVNGKIVFPPVNTDGIVNVYRNAAWLAKNGFHELSPAEIAEAAVPRQAEQIFTKLQIRRALRALNMEGILDAVLSTGGSAARDWQDAQEINLDDDVFKNALAQFGVTEAQIQQIKQQIHLNAKKEVNHGDSV